MRSRMGRRAWLLPVSAAALLVLVVAAVVAAVRLTGRDGTDAPSGAGTGPSSAAVVPVAAGDRLVVFHGLAVEVPAAWPTNALRCATPQRDTVILPGAVETCLTTSRPAVPFVQFGEGTSFAVLAGTLRDAHTEQTEVGGLPATRLTGRQQGRYVVAVAVPSLSAQVLASSPEQATGEALAGTVRVTDTDANGCPAHSDAVAVLPTGRPTARPGADRELVPGTPSAVVVCRYVAGLVEQSGAVDGADRTALLATLNGLPSGVSRANPKDYLPSLCRTPSTAPGSVLDDTAMDSEAYLVRASYASGPSVSVLVRLGLCGDLGASNGTRTGQLTQALAERLAAAAGNSQGWPGDVRPAG